MRPRGTSALCGQRDACNGTSRGVLGLKGFVTWPSCTVQAFSLHVARQLACKLLQLQLKTVDLHKHGKVNDRRPRFAQNSQTIHLFPPVRPYLVRIAGDSEGIMRYRTNPLVPAVYAGSLAAAVVLAANWAVSAAGTCIEKPNQQIDQAGHWYYYVDRERHRRCWFFETSEVTTSPAPSSDRLSANGDSQPSWVSQLAAGLAQTFSFERQQNSALDDSNTVTRTTSPKHPKTNKIAKKEQSRIVPLPETTGVASTERGAQLLPQSTPERNEIQSPQLTAAGRDALYQEFLKWYVDRSILGRP